MEEVSNQKDRKCYNILGWIKQIFYICCWSILIVYVVFEENEVINEDSRNGGQYVAKETNSKILAFLVISMILMFGIYFVSLINLCAGKNRVIKLLSNINESSSINQIMEILLKEKPEVVINCVCYHMETKGYIIDNEGSIIKTVYKEEEVPTYTESQKLNIFSYLDISGIFKFKETYKKYIQLYLRKEINFNDEITIYDIETIKNNLYQKNRHKDSYISIKVNRILPSFKEFYLIKLTNGNNCFLKKWIYIVFFVLTIDKFYELYLDCIFTNQFFVIKKIISTRENVLENPKYSQFSSGYDINEESVTYEEDSIGGIDKEIEVKYPTEKEIALAKDYNKYLPQYMMKDNGEIINTNENSVDNIIEIKEENKQGTFEKKINEKLNDNNEINTDNDTNEINQPLISNDNNFVELKNNKI